MRASSAAGVAGEAAARRSASASDPDASGEGGEDVMRAWYERASPSPDVHGHTIYVPFHPPSPVFYNPGFSRGGADAGSSLLMRCSFDRVVMAADIVLAAHALHVLGARGHRAPRRARGLRRRGGRGCAPGRVAVSAGVVGRVVLRGRVGRLRRFPRTRRFPVERAGGRCAFDWKPARSRKPGDLGVLPTDIGVETCAFAEVGCPVGAGARARWNACDACGARRRPIPPSHPQDVRFPPVSRDFCAGLGEKREGRGGRLTRRRQRAYADPRKQK